MRIQRLFDDEYVCIVRREHASVRGRLTLQQYTSLRHVLIAPSGRALAPLDDAIEAMNLTRRAARSVPYYLNAIELISRSDCIATVSRRLAEQHADRFDLQILRPPL